MLLMYKDYIEAGLILNKLSARKEMVKIMAVDFWALNSAPKGFQSSMGQQVTQAQVCLIRSIIQD